MRRNNIEYQKEEMWIQFPTVARNIRRIYLFNRFKGKVITLRHAMKSCEKELASWLGLPPLTNMGIHRDLESLHPDGFFHGDEVLLDNVYKVGEANRSLPPIPRGEGLDEELSLLVKENNQLREALSKVLDTAKNIL